MSTKKSLHHCSNATCCEFNHKMTASEQYFDVNFLWDLSSIHFIKQHIVFFIFISSLSNWVNFVLKNYNEIMEYFVAVSFYSYTYSPEMKKAKVGFLMRLIFQRFKNKSLSRLNPDYVLCTYCGHQGTLTNILNFLDVFKVTNIQLIIHSNLKWKRNILNSTLNF